MKFLNLSYKTFSTKTGKFLLTLFTANLILSQVSTAQEKAIEPKPLKKHYWSNNMDVLIFSTAAINDAGIKSWGTLRWSPFFNIGGNFHYNISKHLGVYTGLSLKNIGFIERYKVLNTVVKQRAYTLGVPIGISIGDMQQQKYFTLGGGVDWAIHYKQKYWDDNTSKVKLSEWFSDYTRPLLPYIFTGFSSKAISFKIQYYPLGFLNEDKKVGPYQVQINKDKKVNLLLFSIGKQINY